MPKSTVEVEDPGSRDVLRGLLRQTGIKTMESLVEVEKLRASAKRRLEYKKVDCYLGIAIQYIELARIEMRKRKKHLETPKEVIPTAEGMQPEQIESSEETSDE